MFDVQADKYVRLVTNSSSSTTTPVETSIDNDREADIFHTQSRKLNDIVRCLHDAGVIRGWRNEQLRVGGTFDQPLCKVERGASDFFGFLTYGAHMNVYVCMSDDGDFDGGDSKVTGNARVEERDHLHSVSKPKKTKQMTEELKKRTPTHMWISQRSLTKPKAPGICHTYVMASLHKTLSCLFFLTVKTRNWNNTHLNAYAHMQYTSKRAHAYTYMHAFIHGQVSWIIW